jgi:hypothetical protein
MAAGHRRAAWRILPAWSILGERERGYTPVGEPPSRWRHGRSAQLAEDMPRRPGSIRGWRWWPCANLLTSRLLVKLGGGGMAESTASSTCRRWWSPYPWSTWTSRPLRSPLAVPPPCRRRRHHLTPSRCQATARSAPSSPMTKPDGGGSGCGRRGEQVRRERIDARGGDWGMRLENWSARESGPVKRYAAGRTALTM